MSRGLKLRARARRVAAVTIVAAGFVTSGVVPLAAAANGAHEEPPAVDIPLFGQPDPKAPKAPKAKNKRKKKPQQVREPTWRPGEAAGEEEAETEPEPPAEPPAKADEPADDGVKPSSEPMPEAGSASAGAGEGGAPEGIPEEPSGESDGEGLVDPDALLETDPPAGDEVAGASAAGEEEPPLSSSAGESEPPSPSEEAVAVGAAPSGQGAPRGEPPANEGPVTVTTKVSPDPSLVGDRLTLEIIAAYPKGYRVNLPTGVDFSPLHLVSIDEGEPEPSAEGYFRKVFRVTLQHFDVGESRVPGFPLTYVGKDGEVETVRVAPRPFLVDSLLANEADPQRKLEDPPISLEYPNTTAELVIYSAAVAMLAGFFLALFWRRFASRRKVVVGPPPVPAHEIALSALDELEQSEFLETGLVQDYYLELTEIAKGYLEGRFGVDALDRTTDEIRRDLVRHRERIKPLEPDDVLRFLEGCDLVKFARFDPELDEARSALSEVRTMVEETVPTESPAATGKADGAEAAPLGGAEESGLGVPPAADEPAADELAAGSPERAFDEPASPTAAPADAPEHAEPASPDPASGDEEVKT